MAAATRAAERPLTITSAPSRARAVAMANPIPAVEPVTKALLFFRCKSMSEECVSSYREKQAGPQQAAEIPRSTPAERSGDRAFERTQALLHQEHFACAKAVSPSRIGIELSFPSR